MPRTLQGNTRSIAIQAVAKANKLDLEEIIVDTASPGLEYLKINKLGKIPSFVGQDGYALTECIAIAIYSMLWLFQDRSSSSAFHAT